MYMKQKKLTLKMPKGYSKSIHASVLLLTIFGLAMIISAKSNIHSLEAIGIIKVIIKEVGFIVASYLLMLFVARNFSWEKFRKLYVPIVYGTIGLLFLTMIFPAIGGARAWIRTPIGTIQPSEFVKVISILILAQSLGDRGNERTDLISLIKHPVLLVSFMGMFVLLAQSDLGSAVIIFVISLITVLSFSNPQLRKIQKWFLILFASGILLLFFVNSGPFINFLNSVDWPDSMKYMINRFTVSANPFLDRHDSGAQIFNGLAAFVSGGLTGVGYGKGFLKFSFIFAAESDSILAIIVEELGVIFGFLPIVLLYGVIIYQLMKYTFKVKSDKDKAVLVGTIAYFFIHFLLNVGGVTALIPLTGIPLLFISAGGSSRLAVMVAIGLCQNVIARYNTPTRNQKQNSGDMT